MRVAIKHDPDKPYLDALKKTLNSMTGAFRSKKSTPPTIRRLAAVCYRPDDYLRSGDQLPRMGKMS